MREYTELEKRRLLHVYRNPQCHDFMECEPPRDRITHSYLIDSELRFNGRTRLYEIDLTVELACLLAQWEEEIGHLVNPCGRSK
jgi:hypothetical protein